MNVQCEFGIEYEEDFHGATLEVFKRLEILSQFQTILNAGMFDLCPKCLELSKK